MFYSYELLCLKNKGKFCIPWILATTSKTLPKRDIAKVDVRQSCQEVVAMITTNEQQRSKRFSLYLSAVLMHGLCLVHQRQVDIFYDKLVSAQITMAAVGLDEEGNLHPLIKPAELKRKANDPDKTKAKRPKKAKKLVDIEQTSLEGDMEALPVDPRRDSHILIEEVAMPASLLSSEEDGFGALIPEFQEMLLNGDDPFQDIAMQTEPDVVTEQRDPLILSDAEQYEAGLPDESIMIGDALDSLSLVNKEGPATFEPKDPVSPIERMTLAIEPMAAVIEQTTSEIEPTAAVIEPTTTTVEPPAAAIEPTVPTIEPVANTIDPTTSVAEPSVPESPQPAPVTTTPRVSPASQADVTSPDQRRRDKKKAPKRIFQDRNISFTTQDQKKWFDSLALQRIRREQNWEADMHDVWRQGEHVRTDQLIRLPSIATLAHDLELMFEPFTNPQRAEISRHSVQSRGAHSIRSDSTEPLDRISEISAVAEPATLPPSQLNIQESEQEHDIDIPLSSLQICDALVEEHEGSLDPGVIQQPIDEQRQSVGEPMESQESEQEHDIDIPLSSLQICDALVEEHEGNLDPGVIQQPIDEQGQSVGEPIESQEQTRQRPVEEHSQQLCLSPNLSSSLNQDLPTSETVTAEINSLLEGKEFIFFSDLCPPGKCTRMVAALTFGLLQELHQKGICKLTQENPLEFGPIKIEIT